VEGLTTGVGEPQVSDAAEMASRGAVRRARLVGVTVVVLVAAAVLWPVVRRPPQDSFPLSTYPMFSFQLEPVADVDLVVGLDAEGRDVRLSPESIAGTDEVIQAGAAVAQAVAGRGDDPVSLCRRVADRLVGDDPVAVEVRTDRYDAIRWFRGDREPIERTVHARCGVPR
jgi:hypothetical protein